MGACLCCTKNPFPEEEPQLVSQEQSNASGSSGGGGGGDGERRREKEEEEDEEEDNQSRQGAFKYYLLTKEKDIKKNEKNNGKSENVADSVSSKLIEVVNHNDNDNDNDDNNNNNSDHNSYDNINKKSYNNNNSNDNTNNNDNNNNNDNDNDNEHNKSVLVDISTSKEVNEPNRKLPNDGSGSGSGSGGARTPRSKLEKKKSTDTAIQSTEVDENVDWTDESNVRPHAERDHDSSEESSMRSDTNADPQKEDRARRIRIHRRQETYTTTITTITHREKEEKTEVVREKSDKDNTIKDIQISLMATTIDGEPIKPNGETLIHVGKEEGVSPSLLSSSSPSQQKALPILYYQAQSQNHELEKKENQNDQPQKPHPYSENTQIWEAFDAESWNRVFSRCLEKMKHRQYIQYQARFKQFMQNENPIQERQNIENNPEDYYLMEMNHKQKLAENRRYLFLAQRRAKAMIWTKNMLRRYEEKRRIQQKKALEKAKKIERQASARTLEKTIDESGKQKLLPGTPAQQPTTTVVEDGNSSRLSDFNTSIQTYEGGDVTTALQDQSEKSYSEEEDEDEDEEDNGDIKETQEPSHKKMQHEKPSYDSNTTESVHLLAETSSDSSSSEEEIDGLELNRAFKKRRKANKKLSRTFLSCEEHEHGEARVEKIKKQRESLKELYDFYMQQYLEKRKKEQEAARKRNQSLTNIKFPPKPKGEFSSHCMQTLKIIGRFLCAGSRFTGAASFENQTTEVALEIDITSDRNELGEFTGKRTPFDNILGTCEGKGRLWCDMVWNEKKKAYKEAVCFRWMDEQQGVMTVLEFNTVCDRMDIRHAFYEGVIMRYPAFTNPTEAELEKVTQYGIFDFLCTSKKTNYKETLEYGTFGHEWLYAEEESTDQSTEEPKFVQRMFDYAETIEEARTKDKRESLKLPEGEDWASYLFGKSYSVYGARNSNSSSAQPVNLDLQAFDPNLPRRCLALRSRGDDIPN